MRIGIDFDDTIVNTKEIVRKFMDRYNVKEFRTEEEKTIFYKQHVDDVMKEITLKDNVVEVLNRLKDNNELFIITARGTYYSKNLPKLTLDFIENNNIPVDKVYFNCEEKASKCLELKIDLFIDDLPQNCISVNEVGIKTFIFDNVCEGIESVSSWIQIEKAVAEWKKES